MRQLSGVTAILILLLGAGWADASIITVSGGDPTTMAEPVVLGNNLTVIAAPGGSLTISGPISQTGPDKSVTLTGDGELLLSGDNTYTGGTTVRGGELDFANPDAVPTIGILAVDRGGTVDLSGLLAPLQVTHSTPEPAALVVWSLLGLGWAWLSVTRRRRHGLSLGRGRAGRRWSPEARAAIHQIIQGRR